MAKAPKVLIPTLDGPWSPPMAFLDMKSTKQKMKTAYCLHPEKWLRNLTMDIKGYADMKLYINMFQHTLLQTLLPVHPLILMLCQKWAEPNKFTYPKNAVPYVFFCLIHTFSRFVLLPSPLILYFK